MNKHIFKTPDWDVEGRLLNEPIQIWGEDGYYTQHKEYWAVIASSKHGAIYYADLPSGADENDVAALIESLTDNFSAETDERFYWGRNMYGSLAWSMEDEVGLMDEEERFYKGF